MNRRVKRLLAAHYRAQSADQIRDIKPMQEQDAQVACEMIREFAVYLDLLPSVAITTEVLASRLKAEQLSGLIIYFDGQPAGYALYHPRCHSFSGRLSMWLEDIYIRPAYRGVGLGQDLMIHLALTCAQRSWASVDFDVHTKNKFACAFYRKLRVDELNFKTLWSWDEDGVDDFLSGLAKRS